MMLQVNTHNTNTSACDRQVRRIIAESSGIAKTLPDFVRGIKYRIGCMHLMPVGRPIDFYLIKELKERVEIWRLGYHNNPDEMELMAEVRVNEVEALCR
jgi:hypothetical protein